MHIIINYSNILLSDLYKSIIKIAIRDSLLLLENLLLPGWKYANFDLTIFSKIQYLIEGYLTVFNLIIEI